MIKRPVVLLVVLVSIAAGCRASTRSPATSPSAGIGVASAAPQPVVATLAIGGRSFAIRQSDERDPGETPPSGIGAAAPSEVFAGKARKASKLSLVEAPLETFGTVEELWHSLEDDDEMIGRQPPISRGPTSRRVAEEKRLVKVDALLCAASREDDNDFHLIICDDPKASADSRYCLNVEISGLPSAGIYRAPLKKARDEFSSLLQGNLPGDRYQFYDPIPVTVVGALFYDIDHRPGQVGPAALRPDTSWEVHPIKSIVFRP